MRRTEERPRSTDPAGAAAGGGQGAKGSGPEHMDWSGLMRLGLGALRLPPDQFWAMTPSELCRALEGAGLRPIAGLALDRGALDRLMAAHPDRTRND